MSRHKLIKSMNVNEELDDFDGGSDYEDEIGGGEEELSAEDKEQLQEGTAKVRSILGDEVPVTDREIQDSLWHYYYDVEKTVMYLLNQKTASTPKKNNNVTEGPRKAKGDLASMGAGNLHDFPILLPYPATPWTYSEPFSVAEFFKDSPWLNVPPDRQAEILIETLHPPGRLLGGSSQGGPKMSKLAALAAARKKKENEKNAANDIKPANTSVALLDKLSINSSLRDSVSEESPGVLSRSAALQGKAQVPVAVPSPRKYPARKPQSPIPPQAPKTNEDRPTDDAQEPSEEALPSLATPSIFARTMLGPALGSTTKYHTMANPALPAYFSPLMFSNVNYAESDPFAGPSPDDIVANAQSASKGLKKAKEPSKASSAEKPVNGIENGVGKLTIDNSPKAKSKNLDVIAEYGKSKKKNAANFVVIGHVDAGKSTLMGRLLYDLKVVDQRTLDRYRKEADSIGKASFALAWVLDQGSEERSRGVTIDIAMNKFETPTTTFTILDAPGHRDFIPNMIAGASQADFAVLVIDASTGNFESGLKGQTKEHALLVRSLGVQRLVVAVNKLDTVAWSRARFDEISQQVTAFLLAAGYQSRNLAFVPCAGLTGANIVNRAEDPNAAWYTGPVLLDLLESSEPIARALEKPLRLTIADIFRGGVQYPLSISGRLDSGTIQIADTVLAVPSGETAFVKGIEVDSEPADWAAAGQNVVLHLSDIDAVHLKTGDVICSSTAPMKVVTQFAVKILAFEFVTPMQVDLLRGRLHVPGRVTELSAVLDKGSGAVVKKKPRLVKPGMVARVKVTVDVEGGVPLEAGARVVLRAGGETVAAGLVEEV